jgi:HlyD family secretion protein
MRKTIVTIIVLAGIGLTAGAYYNLRRSDPEPQLTTATISRGGIIDSVGATGTLDAVTTVQVGSQVSGTVQALYADFNSIVRQGQVIARLDPSLFETQIDQARANLVRADADVERLRVTLQDARAKLERAEGLSAKNLLPRSELETAQVNVRAAEAQLRSAEAQVTQAQASLNQAEVNLRHTVIRAPIDGIVISRNVDVGQTVAASMQAPVLFLLAADLTKMQVNASIDESDVGRIRPGQHVRFRVDAYPAEEFGGTVQQVRLQPTVVQNVVTYTTVIAVPNPQLELKPGMTATVTVEVARRDGVLRVPAAALRFRPTPDVFAAFGQKPPEPGRLVRFDGPETALAADATTSPAGLAQPAGGAAAPRHGPGHAAAAGDTPQTPPAAAERRGGFDGGQLNPERRRQMMERLQNLPPEERERGLERVRERTASPAAPASTVATTAPGPLGTVHDAQSIDSLFDPLPPTENPGHVWLFAAGQLEPVRVRLGITDGSFTELLTDDLEAGTEVVTGVLLGRELLAGGGARGQSPLMPQRRMAAPHR